MGEQLTGMNETLYFRATVETYTALQPAKKLSARFDIAENYPLFNKKLHDKKAGVYAICGLFGGKTLPKVYIGSAKNLTKRINNHFLLLGRKQHENSALQKAYNKCPAGWIVCILEEIPDDKIPRLVEQNYLDLYRPFIDELNGLNVAKNAMAASLGLKFKRTGKALENLRAGVKKTQQNPEWREKIAASNRAKAKDPEYIAKLKKAQSNRSKEHKEKLLKARRARMNDDGANQRQKEGIRRFHENKTEEYTLKMKKQSKDNWLKPAYKDAVIRKNTAPLPKLINTETREIVEAGFWGARAFCEERGLVTSSFRAMLRGEKAHHRNWRICHE